ncbi:lectin subunit alpha-like [Lucilia sericata]|uniref:lectin subunit alpha-like n=1 Tax=Lucilia sericata TaxID=13632 RepID=UPI0018A84841|nr:lectin subunit alpha-like [Lucilia sericata]
MRETFQIFTIFSILIIKTLAIESTDNLFISEQNQTYYIENEEKYNWFQALTKCASMDMSLVTIDSQEKSDDLNALLTNTFGTINPLWIGALLNDLSPRQYSWISTGDNLTYTNWADGQPNFLARQEYCIQVTSTEDPDHPIQWDDEKCSRPYGFICEYSRYHNLEEEMKEQLAEHLAIEQQLQYELDKSKLFIKFLLDYSKPEHPLCGNKTIRDIILNIN